MNTYAFTGRLARDCEIRTTQGGMSICSFTAAVDYGFGDNKGVNWIRCSLFGKRAEGKLPQYLTKGTQVAVSGELRVRDYTDNGGAKRTSIDLSVNNLDLIGGRQDNSQGGTSGQNNAASQNSRQSSAAPHQNGNNAASQYNNDPFANDPDFGNVPVDDDIPF